GGGRWAPVGGSAAPRAPPGVARGRASRGRGGWPGGRRGGGWSPRSGFPCRVGAVLRRFRFSGSAGGGSLPVRDGVADAVHAPGVGGAGGSGRVPGGDDGLVAV